MNKEIIAQHIYNDSNDQAIKYIQSISDEETLFVYAYNYNWDNGFEVPKAIMTNKNCTLSVALLLFRLAYGLSFLQNKESVKDLPDWESFITALYNQILSGEFLPGKAGFNPNLSKVQFYKLQKILTPEENIFITSINGADYCIDI